MKIIISFLDGYEDIKQKLLTDGIERNDLIVLEEWNNKASQNQYFEQRCISSNWFSGDFIDAGTFDGIDTQRFLEWKAEGNAYCFEPDKKQYIECKKRFKENERVTLLNLGLSDADGMNKFSGLKNGMASYNEKGTETVKVTSIDTYFENSKIGFIKMDIEGYEEKAINGARKTIQRDHPVLAISIYHKREDIWNIPKLLLEINENYRFAFGHYKIGQVDTVLFYMHLNKSNMRNKGECYESSHLGLQGCRVFTERDRRKTEEL